MKLTINLEEHNIKTYEVIQKSLKEKNHIGVVQATGTGKSYIIAKTIVDDDFKKVNSQKKSFKAKKLLPERCERLVSIGFEFPCL